MREQSVHKSKPKAPPTQVNYEIILRMAPSAEETIGDSQLRRNLLKRALDKGSQRIGSIPDLFVRSSIGLENLLHEEYTRALGVLGVSNIQVRVTDMRRSGRVLVIFYNGMRDLQTAACHQPLFYL